jgi:hypothetical protein
VDLKSRLAEVGDRLDRFETDARFSSYSFENLRMAYDEIVRNLQFAQRFTSSNELDFNEVELGLLYERDRLSAIGEALDRVEKADA